MCRSDREQLIFYTAPHARTHTPRRNDEPLPAQPHNGVLAGDGAGHGELDQEDDHLEEQHHDDHSEEDAMFEATSPVTARL